MSDIIQRLIATDAPMNFQKGAEEDLINQYEATTDIRLPSDYRKWLLYSNGGEIFMPGTRFFGIDNSLEHSLTVQNSQEKRSLFSLDKSSLIIGRFNFGDLLCIDLNSGEVIQWDHEIDEEFLRWDNFSAFLDDEITAFIGEGN